MQVDVDARGAFLNAAVSDRVMRAAQQEAQEDMTLAVADRVQARLGQVLRHPTGYYRSRVVADLGVEPPRVTDSGVTYGPWLEGIGSRNATTRFKGYGTFRKVAQEMATEVVRISEPTYSRALSKLNG